jgi:hypothetical protein
MIMKKLVYTIGIALAFGFVSCDKTSEIFDENKGSTISFEPKTVETRALINSVEDLHSSTLRVFDFWSGQASEPYINNTLVYQNSQWQYGTEATYYWKDGTHKFFSFTDALGTLNSSKVVSVSKTLTTAEENQTDLLYSQVFTSTAADWMSSNTATTPVPLTFKHLLSSVAIVVKNCSGTPVTLNSVSASIPNVGSASVNYSADTVAVTLGDVSAGTTPFISAAALSNVTLASQDSVDVLAQAKMAAEDYSYYVIWPQEINEESPVSVDVSYTPDGAEEALVKTVSLPATTWEPGNKYLYVLRILPTGVVLTFKVLPWEKVDVGSIDTKTGSINMSNVTWMNTKVRLTQTGDELNSVVISLYTVNMYYKPWVNGSQISGFLPAQGYFTVNYPTSGKFKIGLIPAYGETEVDESKYAIYIYHKNGDTGTWVAQNADGETITNDTVYFQVRPTMSAPDGNEYKAQVDIWFKPTGSDDWVSAYSEVRANYALTIPAN